MLSGGVIRFGFWCWIFRWPVVSGSLSRYWCRAKLLTRLARALVGVDFSAAEAFVRIQRLLEDKQVVLVLCGCPIDSSVGLALRSVDLWADGAESKVEVFENLNDALEVSSGIVRHTSGVVADESYDVCSIARTPTCGHCTRRTSNDPTSSALQATPSLHLISVSCLQQLDPSAQADSRSCSSFADVPKSELDSDIGMFAQSPRASHLRNAAKETISRRELLPRWWRRIE